MYRGYSLGPPAISIRPHMTGPRPMALEPGSRLGPHEVTGTLGAGGVGKVYRARDTPLKCNVALNVLPCQVVSWQLV